MKKIFFIVAICLCVTSCDFLRKVAGRPTSEEIAAKYIEICRQEKEHVQRVDSVCAETSRVVDSLETIDALRKLKGSVIAAGRLNGTEAASLANRYYVVIGTFSKPENARKIAAEAGKAGYDVTLVKYRSGFTAVALCGSDDIFSINESFGRLKKEKFCPPDIWIMSNE